MILEILFIAIVVAYFVFALMKLEWALTAFPLLMPFYLFKVELLGVPFTLPESVIYVMVAAFILRWINNNLLPGSWFKTMFSGLSDQMFRRPSFFKRFEWVLLAVGLFLIAAFVSLLVVQNQMVMYDGQVFQGMKVALGILKGWVVAPVLLLLLYLAVMESNNRLLDSMNFYALSAVLLSVWALFQVSTDGYITPDDRASGPFESANYLALYIAPAFVYLIIRLKELVLPLREEDQLPFWKRLFVKKNVKESHPEVSIFIIGFLLVFLALLASKAYAGLFAAFAAALFYFVLQFREFKKHNRDSGNTWKFLVGFVIFASMLLSVVYMIDPGKWQSMFRFDERNSSSVRMEVYQVSAGLLGEHWFTGVGLGQYEAYYKQNAERFLGHEPYELNMLHPHNLYLAVWLNMGLLGVFAFIWLMILVFQRCCGHFLKFACEKINSAGKVRMVGAALLMSILIYGFFDTPLFKNDMSMMFWMIIAVIFAADHELQPVVTKKE